MIVRFFDWDQPKNVTSSLKGITPGEKVIIEHEWGTFVGDVILPDKNIEGEAIVGKAVRRAEEDDQKTIDGYSQKERDILDASKKQARDLEIPMKVIDVKISLDGSCAVVAFVADGRVDFRKLVKNLSVLFGKSVRLQQIGSRDEARRCGGFGICGRELCCKKFPGSLKSITTEMARCQLISHRGSERISGLCGRLMCCLAFEAAQYQEMLEGMPQRGDSILVEGKKGVVVDVMVMTGKVRVELEDGTIVTQKVK
jgi:cell fate regulator YaaT (PSP1 superfamily)